MKGRELAVLADEYDEVKQARLAHDRASRALKETEVALSKALIEHCQEEGLTAIGGDYIRLSLNPKGRKSVAIAVDWDKINAYIIENDAWDLLVRHLNPAAVRDRIEQEGDLPGINQEFKDWLSESRVGLKKRDE